MFSQRKFRLKHIADAKQTEFYYIPHLFICSDVVYKNEIMPTKTTQTKCSFESFKFVTFIKISLKYLIIFEDDYDINKRNFRCMIITFRMSHFICTLKLFEDSQQIRSKTQVQMSINHDNCHK